MVLLYANKGCWLLKSARNVFLQPFSILSNLLDKFAITFLKRLFSLIDKYQETTILVRIVKNNTILTI